MYTRSDFVFFVAAYMLGFAVFFAVSGIPFWDFMPIIISVWLINTGSAITLSGRHDAWHLAICLTTTVLAIVASTYLWGWSYIGGSAATGAFWLVAGAIWFFGMFNRRNNLIQS